MSAREKRAGLIACVALIPFLFSPAPTLAQQLLRSEDAVVALFSLQTEREVDIRMMKRLETRHDENRRERIEAREKLVKLYEDLDALFADYRISLSVRRTTEGEADSEHARPEDPAEGEGAGTLSGVERLEELILLKERDVMAAERAQANTMEEGHRLRDQIRDLRLRMTLLAQQIAALEKSMPTQRDAVTGIWDITMLPSGDKGTFALFQSGTLVTGQYVLVGPFQGSLDGTLIDRKLLLHRIDSRLGRSMDLHATLSSDGQALRGSWENYDLANGQVRTGAWAGRRRPGKRPDDEPGEDPGTRN